MKELQNKYEIKNIHTDYMDLLNDDIDIVYVAVPNHLHYQFAKQAIEKKKHVLLEKPFASSTAQAKELINLAKEHNVILFEAISNQYLPNYSKVKELIKDLGDIKIVQLNYSQYSRRYDLFKEGTVLPVFDVEQSGGALMDLNVYNIHFIVGLFGKPDAIAYIANIERGIDTSGILTLDYPNFKCVAIGAKDCKSPVSINIQGDKGYIHSDDPANVFQQFVFGENLGNETEYQLNNNKNRLYYEVAYFARLVTEENYKIAEELNQHTISVMEILDAGREQVGIKVC
ncbi:MAG: Gfo/Idh/MocA family protein [Coprobacillaceae bacterium]